MSKSNEIAISEALEQLALALGESAAVPRGELIRALERAADRLRGPSSDLQRPTDLVSQAEAARLIGVSRQAVNQWARKGWIRTYEGENGGARRGLVSASEVTVVSNRSRIDPVPDSMQREIPEFLAALENTAAGPLASQLAEAFSGDANEIPTEPGGELIRDFLVAAMESDGQGPREEFTPAGIRMLAELRPSFEIDRGDAFGLLADRLGLVVHTADARSGFDSFYSALLGLLGVATIGSCLEDDEGEIGRVIAKAASEVWGEDWVRRMFDAVYHSAPRALAPVTRLTGSLLYLASNRFIREAQTTGVSVTYARLAGALLPQSYYGRPLLEDHVSGRPSGAPDWWVPSASIPPRSGSASAISSPFRIFNFEYGLYDDSIRGVRRCFFSGDSSEGFAANFAALPEAARTRSLELATETLARILAKPYVEFAVVEAPGEFDWWKNHTIRAAASEIVLGLRGSLARNVCSALAVRTQVLPNVVEGETDDDLRERLRIYAKNLDFSVIDERYHHDLVRSNVRVVKSASSAFEPKEAREFAEGWIRMMLESGDAASVAS